LIDAKGEIADTVEVGDSLELQVRVAIKAPIPRLVLGFMIKDRLGQPIYGINTHRLDMALSELVDGEEVLYRYRFPANLGKGSYSLSLSLSKEDSHLGENYEWRDNALIFHVFNSHQENFVGTSWLDAKVDVDRYGKQREVQRPR
jgi:lipopolysaccharide transport system ATP-binding protein